MTRRQTRIADWPFPADQEVLLTWVRSPHRTAAGSKQWRTIATFVPLTDGATPQAVELPWGMLPSLRLGVSYLDGYLHKRSAQGGEHNISIRQFNALVTARECLGPVAWADLSGEDGHELLFVLEADRGLYFLPVCEAIRVLLAPNKTLALGLLEADYLARVVTDSRVVTHVNSSGENRVLHLDFMAEVASAALDRSIVRHVGRLLHDDTFRRAWDAVERERHRRTGTAGPTGELPRVPLRFPLPELRDSWRVRASMIKKDAYLVVEVLSVTAAMELPFSDVIYTDPGFARTVRKPVAPGDHGKPVEDGANFSGRKEPRASRSTSLSTTSSSPRNSRRPRCAGTISYGLHGDENISIRRLANKERVKRVLTAGAEDSVGWAPNPASVQPGMIEANVTGDRLRRAATPSGPNRPPAEEVSLGAAASNGEHAQGEFQVVMPDPASDSKLHPLPLECRAHDGLDAFASALGTLSSLDLSLQITWYMDQLVGKGSYARMGSQPRRYVLVRCAGGLEPPCWLLEFAQLDRRAPSTLILFPIGCANFEAFRQFVAIEMLPRALHAEGWWNWSELMKLRSEQRLRFAFLRHESLEPERWADRLHRGIRAARRSV